jgi:hypothetical protein
MTLSNLYFRGCFEQPSDDQKDAIEEAGGIAEVVDKSCSRASVNTCGMSIEQLFDMYSIYNPQKGLYKSWGDIEFPWQISNLTPNLLLSNSNNKWDIAQYRSIVAYQQNSLVLLIEDDGYRVGLYKAKQNILAITGAFDYSKWDRICQVETTVPAGLPSVKELLERYDFYELKLFDTEWGKYNRSWDEALKTQSLQSCVQQGLTLSDLQNCLDGRSSDEWDGARVRRDFFYRAGDIVLVGGECEDTICVYIARQDIPATEEALTAQAVFNPRSPLWQKIYCVPTGRNRCLEYQRKKEPALGYDVVEIGSKGHFVEVPVPYRLAPRTRTLDEKVEIVPPPRVLTQAEINALNQPQEED